MKLRLEGQLLTTDEIMPTAMSPSASVVDGDACLKSAEATLIEDEVLNNFVLEVVD
jgi:hypothetical protein